VAANPAVLAKSAFDAAYLYYLAGKAPPSGIDIKGFGNNRVTIQSRGCREISRHQERKNRLRWGIVIGY
jgi:hypothetical protein